MRSRVKTIYWWEWGHRQLGRFLGLFFFIPFVGFWAKGVLPRGLSLKLLAIGALGGLQATVGWIMVASGLEPGMTAVAPLKLMLHLTLATLILAGWCGWRSGLKAPERTAAGRYRVAAKILLGMVLVQIALGGLVAGSKRGSPSTPGR
jgi:cytochrome c oxidase assembly protein subunit 15